MSASEGQREPTLHTIGDAASAGPDPRVNVVAAMLIGPGGPGLSDRDQALARAMHTDLLARIEDDLRARMATAIDRATHPALAAVIETARVRIAGPILDQARIPVETGLVTAILRRLDEDRLVRRLRALRGGTGEGTADPLLDDGDPAVAEAAAALLAADSRRQDRFGEPRIEEADLAPATRHALVWTVGAAIARYLCDRHALSFADADRLVGDAAVESLATPRDDAAAHAAATLVDLLDIRARLDDRLIADALAAGRIAFFVAALARCAGTSIDRCWRVVAGQPGEWLLTLLRAAEMAPDTAREVLAALSDTPVELAQAFDTLDPDYVAERLRRWRLEPVYRSALLRMRLVAPR